MKTPLRTAVLIFILSVFSPIYSQQFDTTPDTLGVFVTVGTAWADYDNDGYPDIYMSNGLQSNFWVNYLYDNNGDGTFTSNTSAGPIVSDSHISGGISWGDFDNDGDIDVIAAHPQTSIGFNSESKLYRNENDGSFVDASAGDFGSNNGSDSRASVGWADFNNDGWLDILESNATFFGTGNPFAVYQNDQDGTFTSITNNITSGTSARAGFALADFDEDGDIDVVTVSGGVGQHTIFWEDTGANYDSTRILVAGNGHDSQTATWFDYDNDGDLDLFVGCGGDDMSNPTTNHIFQNTGSGLSEVTSGVGDIITISDFALASAALDFDNDGDMDLYVGTDGNQSSNPPSNNHLFENNGSGVFTENTATVLDDNGFARSGAVADYDLDGDIDLMLGREGPNQLFTNNEMQIDGTMGWAGILCQGDGTAVNTTAIGALVKLNATISSSNYTQIRDVSAQTGRGSHHSFRQHIGLGDATKIDQLDVFWSTTNTTTSYTDLPTNKNYVYAYGDLTATASTKTIDGFVYLFGNTGAGVEVETHGDSSVGTVTATRTNSDPGSAGFTGSATGPDLTTVTPNVVASERYWTITTSMSSFTAEVYLDITGIGGVSNPDKLVIMSRANSGSAWTPHNTLRVGNTLYTNADLTSFSEFAIGADSQDNSLPVELAAFKAISGDASVTLEWATASELNNLGFILERSMDKEEGYSEIASYKYHEQLKGQGNSSAEHSYRFVDYNAVNGKTYYYRLSDVSNDGLRTYHGSVEARPMQIISSFALHQNYPNPFNPSTKIVVDIPVSENALRTVLSVYNASGQKVRDVFSGQLSGGSHNFSWDGKNSFGEEMSSGVYFFLLRSGDYTASRKMLLIR